MIMSLSENSHSIKAILKFQELNMQKYGELIKSTIIYLTYSIDWLNITF